MSASIMWLISVIGAAWAHPSAINALALLIIAPILASSLAHTRRVSSPRWLICGIFTSAVLATAPLLTLIASGRVASLTSFSYATSWLDALYRPLSALPPFPPTWYFVITAVAMPVIVVTGLVTAWLTRHRRTQGTRIIPTWFIGSWLILGFVVAIAYAPDFGLKILTAAWYGEPRRVLQVFEVVTVPVISVTVTWIIEAIAAIATRSDTTDIRWANAHNHRFFSRTNRGGLWAPRVVLAVIVALALVFGAWSRHDALARIYDPEHLGPGGMSSTAELEFFRNTSTSLPENSLIIGDPSVGTVFFQALGNRRVVFPQLANHDGDERVRLLTWRFHSIGTDPEVCETIRTYGITHFYADLDTPTYGTPRSELRPGFYDVPVDATTRGEPWFEPVATSDTGTLYRIRVCDLDTPQ